MTTTSALFALALVSVTVAYPEGPPIQINPEICESMFPVGHNAEAQTSDAPFAIVTNAECYKDNVAVEVAVKVKSDPDEYFEGVFVEARTSGAGSTMSYGRFAATDKALKTLDCFRADASAKRNNALSQANKKHYTCKKFTWTPPENFTEEVTFWSTIVHETETFWVNVTSASLKSDASCTTTTVDLCPKGTSGSDQNEARLFPLLLVTMALIFLSVSLP